MFYAKISKEDILWVLSGSTSLVIQGVDVTINNDIDILTDKKGSIEIDRIFAEFRVKDLDYSTTDKYKSYFGIYRINNIQVEVMGDFQYKMNNGEWADFNQNNEIFIKIFEGMNLPLLKLEQEYKEYFSVGNHDKAEKIKELLTQ